MCVEQHPQLRPVVAPSQASPRCATVGSLLRASLFVMCVCVVSRGPRADSAYSSITVARLMARSASEISPFFYVYPTGGVEDTKNECFLPAASAFSQHEIGAKVACEGVTRGPSGPRGRVGRGL